MKERNKAFLTAHCKAEIESCMLTIDLLNNHPAGVGEHSEKDFTDNLTSALQRLHDADGMLQTIEKYLND